MSIRKGHYVLPLVPINPLRPMPQWLVPGLVIEHRMNDSDVLGYAIVIKHIDGTISQSYSNYYRIVSEEEHFLLLLKYQEEA